MQLLQIAQFQKPLVIRRIESAFKNAYKLMQCQEQEAQEPHVYATREAMTTGATPQCAILGLLGHGLAAFTLLEVLITLALVAILMVAAAPYMRDAWQHNEGDRVQESIATLVEQTHSQSLLSGETRFINLTDPTLLPKDWKLAVKRFNDKKFRPPTSDELWQFNSEGICDPLSLQISGKEGSFIMKFDPITAQVLHDE